MLAIVYDGEARLRTDVRKPRVSRGEALVAVRLGGICSTDLEILRGYMGFEGVMGHEFVGVVEAGPSQWMGKRVVGEINCVCGRCDMCRSGLSNHCRKRTVLGIDGRAGCFAEYVAVPTRNLHQVPAGVTDLQAVFAEPLAAALQVLRQVKLDASAKAVVLGDGRLGQLVARAIKSRAGRPVLVGKHRSKLEAAEKQGIQTVALEEFNPAADADVVIEATGDPAGLELAMRAVRPRGTIVLKSTYAGEKGINLTPLVINEVTVVGSRCGPFPEALKALGDNEVDISALVSRRFPLSEGLDALKAARRRDVIKVIIEVSN